MNVNVHIPDQVVNDLIITAVEQGCSYWTKEIRLFDLAGKRTPSVTDKPLENLSLITFVMDEEGEFKQHDLGLARCVPHVPAGLARMATQYPQHFANVIGDDHDAETADVFVQCCVFGKIKSG